MRNDSIIATPPGETIKDQLIINDIDKDQFEILMYLSNTCAKKLLEGEAELTPEVAVCLEKIFGIPANFWNNLERNYRARLDEINRRDESKDCRNCGS